MIICSDVIPENYCLDNNDNIYKKCDAQIFSELHYETYKQNIEHTNNYELIKDTLPHTVNYYGNCEYNYYLTENNEYKCTESNECPSQYSILIINKKKCIDVCQKDEEYITINNIRFDIKSLFQI